MWPFQVPKYDRVLTDPTIGDPNDVVLILVDCLRDRTVCSPYRGKVNELAQAWMQPDRRTRAEHLLRGDPIRERRQREEVFVRDAQHENINSVAIRLHSPHRLIDHPLVPTRDQVVVDGNSHEDAKPFLGAGRMSLLSL